MRSVVQRVSEASVRVGGEVIGSIGPGLCVLVGVTHDDDETVARRMAEKIWGLRILADATGAMNVAVSDAGGELLVVSQFTLYGDARKGRRPSFVDAAPGARAEPLVESLVAHLRRLGGRVSTGRFGADMSVSLVNDGPVTIILEL